MHKADTWQHWWKISFFCSLGFIVHAITIWPPGNLQDRALHFSLQFIYLNRNRYETNKETNKSKKSRKTGKKFDTFVGYIGYKQQSPHFQIQFSTHQRKISNFYFYFSLNISKPNKQTGHNSLTNEMLGNSRFALFQVFYFTSRPYRCDRDFFVHPHRPENAPHPPTRHCSSVADAF